MVAYPFHNITFIASQKDTIRYPFKTMVKAVKCGAELSVECPNSVHILFTRRR